MNLAAMNARAVMTDEGAELAIKWISSGTVHCTHSHRLRLAKTGTCCIYFPAELDRAVRVGCPGDTGGFSNSSGSGR
jgi:hypothetical protein